MDLFTQLEHVPFQHNDLLQTSISTAFDGFGIDITRVDEQLHPILELFDPLS